MQHQITHRENAEQFVNDINDMQVEKAKVYLDKFLADDHAFLKILEFETRNLEVTDDDGDEVEMEYKKIVSPIFEKIKEPVLKQMVFARIKEINKLLFINKPNDLAKHLNSLDVFSAKKFVERLFLYPCMFRKNNLIPLDEIRELDFLKIIQQMDQGLIQLLLLEKFLNLSEFIYTFESAEKICAFFQDVIRHLMTEEKVRTFPAHVKPVLSYIRNVDGQFKRGEFSHYFYGDNLHIDIEELDQFIDQIELEIKKEKENSSWRMKNYAWPIFQAKPPCFFALLPNEMKIKILSHTIDRPEKDTMQIASEIAEKSTLKP